MSEPTSGAAAEVVPYCYRHADRETYVRCTRCERSICPDCMRDAAVGFQCPDCVKEGNRSVRQARTVFGGAITGQQGELTRVLIGINVVAFLLQGELALGLTGGGIGDFTRRYALVGEAFRPPFALIGVVNGEYYRLITSAFLHGGILHLAMNMYGLYLMGTQLEQLLGKARYLTLYLVCALGGSTLSYLVHGKETLAVGASTALFGFFGAFYMVARRLRADTSQIVGLIGINLVFTFLIPIIDEFGHIGGLLTGLAVGVVFTKIPARKSGLQVAAIVAVVAVIVLAVALRTAGLQDDPVDFRRQI